MNGSFLLDQLCSSSKALEDRAAKLKQDCDSASLEAEKFRRLMCQLTAHLDNFNAAVISNRSLKEGKNGTNA